MDAYLVSRLPRDVTDEFIAQVEAHGSSFLGPQYEPTVRIIAGDGQTRTVITIVRNVFNPLPEYLFKDRSTIYVFQGISSTR